MIYHINKFIAGNNFRNALKVTFAAVLPVLLFSYLGEFKIGFTIAIGVFLTYPSDIQSNLKHKINGIFVAAVMVAGANLLINLFYPFPFLFYPFFVGLLFFFSMISVYGQRATMVSFSVLLSICLSFANLNSGWAMLQHSSLLLIGGLFYLFVSLAFHYISPYRYIDLQIAECIKLTSKYLKLRGDLWTVNAPREKIIEKQLHLQVELNTIHESLREIIFRNQSSSGSSYQNRKMLIALISLIEILELALSTSFNHSKLHEKFSERSTVLATYQKLAYSLASTLKRLSTAVENKQKFVINDTLFTDLENLEKAISTYEQKLGKEAASEGVLILSNMQHYAEKQIEKIKILERAYSFATNQQDLKGKGKDLEKFITPQYYPFSTFKENLSFSSTLFRHSLRLTITIIIGYIIGENLPFQNVHWILLTIVVIMRPGYGLTKKRSFERIQGTILGGLIAFGIISIFQNHILISILAIISMLLGFAFTQINYRIGATFVTMYVIFIFGILSPNISDVIEYRILDTITGGALAYIANYFLWPSWEFLNINSFLKKSIKVNQHYIKEISLLYNNKGEVTTSYKLSRKNAFIEIGNLMTSFQRMSQEPKSKQKQLTILYKLVELNHTLLSSSASLGTYVQTHHTTKASNAFNVVIDSVIKNLDFSIKLLQLNNEEFLSNKNILPDLEISFTQLKNIRAKEIKESSNLNEEEFQLKMQESQLVIEQLIWLSSLSEKIIKTIENLKKV